MTSSMIPGEDDFDLRPRHDLALAPALRAGETDRLLYDGECGLCHKAVGFVLRHDVSQKAFRFTPLQSELAAESLKPSGVDFNALPDSVVVITARGEVFAKSDAALYIGERMGGIWRILARAAYAVPRAVRDEVYDFIARIRYRLFAKPAGLCPVPPPRARAMFEI